MRAGTIRITIELSETDLEVIERAAKRMNGTPDEFARYAALRMARQDAALLPAGAATTPGGVPSLPSRRSLRPVIERATIPIIELLRQLEDHLGAQLVAITAGVKPQELTRWVGHESVPSPLQERRLREAHEAWQLVMSVESSETTRAWWLGMKAGLGDLSPAEAISLGHADAVLSVAREFVESG